MAEKKAAPRLDSCRSLILKKYSKKICHRALVEGTCPFRARRLWARNRFAARFFATFPALTFLLLSFIQLHKSSGLLKKVKEAIREIKSTKRAVPPGLPVPGISLCVISAIGKLLLKFKAVDLRTLREMSFSFSSQISRSASPYRSCRLYCIPTP